MTNVSKGAYVRAMTQFAADAQFSKQETDSRVTYYLRGTDIPITQIEYAFGKAHVFVLNCLLIGQ
jgi:hypothetical protein